MARIRALFENWKLAGIAVFSLSIGAVTVPIASLAARLWINGDALEAVRHI